MALLRVEMIFRKINSFGEQTNLNKVGAFEKHRFFKNSSQIFNQELFSELPTGSLQRVRKLC